MPLSCRRRESRCKRRKRRAAGRRAAAEVETLEDRVLLTLTTPTFDPVVDGGQYPVTLTWSSDSEADHYRITIKNLETGERISAKPTTNSFSIYEPLAAGSYRAWVRSEGPANVERSGWSRRLDFAVPPFQQAFQLHPQPWDRRDEPVLSSLTTDQDWASQKIYHAAVVHHEGKFRMWYAALGDRDADRVPPGFNDNDSKLGYAESIDGINWTTFDEPVLRNEDIPWRPPLGTPGVGEAISTPYVMFDEDEQLYKLWFSSTTELTQDESGEKVSTIQIGYATSPDGIN